MEPDPLRVGADRGRTVTPEGPHLRLIIQIGAGEDHAGDLYKPPVSEHIGQAPSPRTTGSWSALSHEKEIHVR